MKSRAPDRSGEHLANRYLLQRRLGSGGMGSVYEAEQLATGRKVAVKLLHPELARDEEMVARFQREARAAAALESEHVAAVLDLGEAQDGTPFLAMELLHGETLRSLLTREGQLPLVRVARLVTQACHALAEAHACGVVHRDLKPENLFLTRRSDGSDWAKVLDFGVAKLTATDAVSTRAGALLGTVLYMSPEQARGAKDVDARTDTYSLCAIAYEALSGRPPHEPGEQHAVVYRILHESFEPLATAAPGLPNEVCELVERGLSRQADSRLGLEELARGMARFAGVPRAAPAPSVETARSDAEVVSTSPTEGPPPPATRTSARTLGLVAFATLTVAVVAWSFSPTNAAPPSVAAAAPASAAPLQLPAPIEAPSSAPEPPPPAAEPPPAATESARATPLARHRSPAASAIPSVAPAPSAAPSASGVRQRVQLGF